MNTLWTHKAPNPLTFFLFFVYMDFKQKRTSLFTVGRIFDENGCWLQHFFNNIWLEVWGFLQISKTELQLWADTFYDSGLLYLRGEPFLHSKLAVKSAIGVWEQKRAAIFAVIFKPRRHTAPSEWNAKYSKCWSSLSSV